MKMSEEMAVRLHRMMWSDMQRELGDTNCRDRGNYKENWLAEHFPGEHFMHNCILCEYVAQQTGNRPLIGSNECRICPIKWPGDNCSLREREGGVYYLQSPISEILALPARNGEKRENDPDLMSLAYCNAKRQLAKASGLSEEDATIDHIKAIQKKASNEQEPNGALENLLYDAVNTLSLYQSALSYESKLPSNAPIADHIKAIKRKAETEGHDVAKEYIAEYSGVSQNKLLFDHIKAIKEKAVEEYFEKTPGAKLATMDVDDAFKQYAKEQKEPIFHALAEASGLSASNESVRAHISEIRSKANGECRKETIEKIFKSLSVFSGISADIWVVGAHVDAIREKASDATFKQYAEEQMEPLKQMNDSLTKRHNAIKNFLAQRSGLVPDSMVAEHVHKIEERSVKAGAAEERERIQKKIEELLS